MSKFIKTVIFITVIFIGMQSNVANACDIKFNIVSGEKDTYSVGDEIVVEANIILTHRVCSEGISSTIFNTNGLKILAATKWKENSVNVWTRKLKLTVIAVDDGKLTLSATRTCDVDGGYGIIKLN